MENHNTQKPEMVQEISGRDAGVPSIKEWHRLAPTACRILSGVDEELFALGFMEWIGEQILSQGSHFVLMVKKNQPQSYSEIVEYLEKMSEDCKKMEKDIFHEYREWLYRLI